MEGMCLTETPGEREERGYDSLVQITMGRLGGDLLCYKIAGLRYGIFPRPALRGCGYLLAPMREEYIQCVCRHFERDTCWFRPWLPR